MPLFLPAALAVEAATKTVAACAGTLSVPLLGSAQEIIPENLATVLGKLPGIESIHHRHF